MSMLRLAKRKKRVEQLVTRCGAGARLVIDTLLPCEDLLGFYPASKLAYITTQELGDAVRWMLQEPLWSSLQDGRASASAAAAAKCRLCMPAEPLEVLHLSRSGSKAEGVDDGVIGLGGNSDFNTMHQIGGPFRWTEAGAEQGCISPQSTPQLWAKPTSSHGFVTLHWVRTSQCAHQAPLPALPADSIRRLMWYHCRVWSQYDADITTPGPAVNVRLPDDTDGGTDHVPCLHMPWWPAKEEFLHRHRVTDFPPAAARRDICQFGVHLVPTGHLGSDTEQSEWRVSFSRAETVAARHLSPVQRATVKAVKSMKTSLKDSNAESAMKSYHIKTAVLWLAQDQPSDRWTGVTDGVHMVLDWLERQLTTGSLLCFFWPAIDLLEGLSTDQLKNMTSTVRQMKTEATHLLIACCEDKYPSLYPMLKGGSETLSERHLRLCLARLLIREAVVNGTWYRPTAPCWEPWSLCFIPPLIRLSEHRLLEWRYHCHSGKTDQQCCMLQALSVAPADLVGEARLTSLGGDMFTFPVTPLVNLLTESDLQHLLVDPPEVAAWCRQQLCRPPAERPAGLTAQLDTPRGRTELLLQPKLFLRALSEAVPDRRAEWQRLDQKTVNEWRENYQPPDTYQKCRHKLQVLLSCDLELWLPSRLFEIDGPTAAATACLWRQRLHHLLSGDRLRVKYTAITTQRTDSWQLRQYTVLDSPTEGSPQRDERGAAGSEQWRDSLQEREELERRHCQELKDKERRRRQELKEQEKLHLQEGGKQERRHRQERDELERRHRR